MLYGSCLGARYFFREEFLSMLSYIWPIALVIFSNTVYQVCAKAMPTSINPLASLTVTYATGAVASGALYFALNREYTQLNWVPFVFGIALVGLEAGYIYAYKAGWQVSTAATVQSSFLAVSLLIAGFVLYREPISANKVLGLLICMVGLYFINKK
jgi:drug/metabolite transporter (DMT)-like permease